MKTTRLITRLIIHCAATPNGKSLTRNGISAAQTIDEWHRARGFKRDWKARADWNPGLQSIGYHWVIDTDGTVYAGRGLDEPGAHAAGYNLDSLGICLVGTDKFTPAQWGKLKEQVAKVRQHWPTVQVIGHRELPKVAKSCPGFDVGAWESGSRIPLVGHIV